MTEMTLSPLWERIGADGMPPLAKTVLLGDKVVGRIVDETDYADDGLAEPRTVFAYEMLGPDGDFHTRFQCPSVEHVLAKLRKAAQP